jgi:hypothetical protein
MKEVFPTLFKLSKWSTLKRGMMKGGALLRKYKTAAVQT